MDYARVNRAIIQFLQEQVIGFDGYVLGVSGGIDSALTLALATQAIGRKNIHCILMPFWENDNLRDGIEIVHQFDVPYSIVNIRNIYDAFYNTGILWKNGTKENIMSRIRMCLLYAFASEHNRKVLGTCNLSEIMTGYFTKYGDGGTDLEPIGELLKREVYGLARYYNEVLCPKYGYPMIPEVIFTKKPTADLTPGHNDEDDLGSYDVLDDVLTKIYLNQQEPTTPDEIRIAKIIEQTEHKRTLQPMAIVRWDENSD